MAAESDPTLWKEKSDFNKFETLASKTDQEAATFSIVLFYYRFVNYVRSKDWEPWDGLKRQLHKNIIVSIHYTHSDKKLHSPCILVKRHVLLCKYCAISVDLQLCFIHFQQLQINRDCAILTQENIGYVGFHFLWLTVY